MDKLSDMLEFLELTKREEVYRVLSPDEECMGDITLFWDGEFNFMAKSKFALVGVPEEKGITAIDGPSGANDGPKAFRKAFYKMSNHFRKPWGMMVDLGNVRIDLDSDVTSTHRKVEKIVKFLIQNDIFPIIIGGGSDLTYASVKGMKESGKFNRMGMVSIDAHLDMHNIPERFVAASAMRRIMEEFPDFMPVRNMMFLGTRKETVSCNTAEFVLDNNIQVFYKDRIKNLKNDLLFCMNTAKTGVDSIMVSFDLDSCDAGRMPGTSFPLPGGFSPDDIILIANSLSKYKLAVYLDIVELNPRVDTNNITAVMAALFLFHFFEKK